MMTDFVVLWLGGFCTGCAMSGYLFNRTRRDRDWRRSFNHENTNRPPGDPPLKFRRRTDKPQFPPQEAQ